MKARLLLLISAFVTCISTSFALDQVSGVYQISTAQDLVDFATLVNGGETSASALVLNDIDASSVTYTPIGSTSQKYAGTFDGGGYTITLNLTSTSSDYQGLFGVIGKATILNVTVDGTVTGASNVGGIVGYVQANGGTITNCHNKTAVTSSGAQVGGIVGYAYQYGCTISECTNHGAVTGGGEFVGGILGRVDYASVTIEKCVNYGDLSCSSGNIAGIVAWANSRSSSDSSRKTVITACANRGRILSGSNAGAIVGYFDYNLYMTSCYNESTYDTTLKMYALNSGNGTKRFTNCYNINNVTELNSAIGTFTADELTSGALCYKLNGSSTENMYWYQTLTEGSTADLVLTVAEDGSNVVYGYYADCTPTMSYTNDKSLSIYTSPAHKFTGTDGACVSCNKTKSEVDWVLTGATVDNATVTVTVTRDEESVTLTNGESTVKVGETLNFTITPNSGYYFTDGTNAAKNPSIELEESNISIDETTQTSTGVIVVSLSDYAVHQHEYGEDGKCTTCSTLKTYTLADYSNASTYSRYVSSIAVTRGTEALSSGATLTYGEELTVTIIPGTDMLWSDDATIAAGTARTFTITVGLTDPNDEINAKIALAICPHNTMTNGVCVKCGYYAALTDDDKYTEGNYQGYYKIKNAGDLMAFADIVNASDGNTDFNAIVTAENGIDFSNITSVSYTPIGRSENHMFRGIFDGNNKTITLNINAPKSYHQGLFGFVGYCTIKNVTVAGTIKGNSYVAGIVALLNKGQVIITNCHNKAEISGDAYIGGILGDNYYKDCEITECTNYAPISGSLCSGGIVGGAYSGNVTISKCVNEGTISAISNMQGYTGGIIGYADSNVNNKTVSITACANRGSVSNIYNTTIAGALVGYLDHTIKMTSCYNEVSGLDLCGKEGNYKKKTLTRCYNASACDGAKTFTSEELANGALCYNLNGGVTNMYWYQKLTGDDKDAHPVLTATDNEANVVNKGSLKEYGAETGTDVYFNSTTLVENSDATKFYELGLTGVTATALNNLKSNCPATAKNILVEDNDAWYCGYAELLDGTAYAIDKDYTAAKFTYERTLKTTDKGINTFVLPVEVSTDDINGTVYKLSGYEDGVLKFEPVEGTTLEANTPYLVQCEADAYGNAPTLLASTLENVTVKAMTAGSVTAGDATHIGTYLAKNSTDNASEFGGNTLYGYMDGAFIKATGTWTLNPFRTLITVPNESAVNALAIDLNGEVTSLNAVLTDDASSSASADVTPVDVYTLSGLKLRTATPRSEALRDLPAGVYIVGGQKVIKN